MIQNDSENFKDIQLYPVISSFHAGPRILQSPRAAGSSLDVELIDAGVSRRTFYGGLLRYNYYIAADSGDRIV